MKSMCFIVIALFFSVQAIGQSAKIENLLYEIKDLADPMPSSENLMNDSLLLTVEFNVKNIKELNKLSIKLNSISGNNLFEDNLEIKYYKNIIYLKGENSSIFEVINDKVIYKKTFGKNRFNPVNTKLYVEGHLIKGDKIKKEIAR